MSHRSALTADKWRDRHLSDAVGDEPNHENPWTHLNPGYDHRSPHNPCKGAKEKKKELMAQEQIWDAGLVHLISKTAMITYRWHNVPPVRQDAWVSVLIRSWYWQSPISVQFPSACLTCNNCSFRVQFIKNGGWRKKPNKSEMFCT